MLKNAVSFNLGLLALILSIGGNVAGAEPVKFSTIASAKEMAEEISAKVALVEKSLADEESYNKDKKRTLPREAGTIAVLAQAVAEHDEDSDLKKTAPDVREGAIALAKAGRSSARSIRMPDFPSSIWSWIPPTRLATIGRAFHMPSETVSPKPSARLFCTITSARR